MNIDRIALMQKAHAALRERNILPNTKSAYEVWFRHFDSDIKDIYDSVKHHDGDILPWLYDTAEIYADPSTEYADKGGRRIARKLISQFA